MVSIPWFKRSKVRHDLKRAQAVLDEDHFGLDEVKERILEYLAVQKRVRKLKGPVFVSGWATRRGQDITWRIDREIDQQEIYSHGPGWRPRRGRNPRPSQDLYRLYAREAAAKDVQGRRQEPTLPPR